MIPLEQARGSACKSHVVIVSARVISMLALSEHMVVDLSTGTHRSHPSRLGLSGDRAFEIVEAVDDIAVTEDGV